LFAFIFFIYYHFVIRYDTNSYTITRGHVYKLQPCHCRLDTRKYFFSQMVIGPWNSLPASEAHFSILGCFKSFSCEVDLLKYISKDFNPATLWNDYYNKRLP